MDVPVKISVTELQSGLLGILARAKAGEQFVVWDGDQVVAQLSRPRVQLGALSHLEVDMDAIDEARAEAISALEARTYD